MKRHRLYLLMFLYFTDKDSSSGISNFEYGRRSCCTDQTASLKQEEEKLERKGVVRDTKSYIEEVIEKICDFASTNGFELLHLDYSPIKGPEGNIEYLLHMKKNRDNGEWTYNDRSDQGSGGCITCGSGKE